MARPLQRALPAVGKRVPKEGVMVHQRWPIRKIVTKSRGRRVPQRQSTTVSLIS
ncbi:hypothetical protein SHAL103562_04570 [Shewanella algae]